ncbi:MAG: alpha/beta hydrolase [Desulfobacteraceae bacterium]|nr:alpha/beta hydrolase [Desulfobacteraceae bacterium]
MSVLKVNDVSLYYEQTGEGEAIVFLHGYTGSTQDWADQVKAVSDRYKAIAIDNRGHGKSEAPKAEEDYSINIFSEDLYALLRQLGIDRCCLVGHSMGGFISLQFILDHPELVKALVLVDTSSGDFERAPGFVEFRAKLDELARNEGLEAAFEYDAANNPMRIERFQKHPELREVTRRKVMNTSVDGYVYVARTFGKWQPVTGRLNEIAVPTLIFLGEEDAPFIKASQTMKESIKDSRLVTVPGVGHSPHEEAPDLFNKAFLDFLSKIEW